jgi:hypothetical protein
MRFHANSIAAAAVVLWTAFSSDYAHAQQQPTSSLPRRVALVIGIAEYERLPPIRRPAADARVVHDALGGLGWESTLVLDADHRGFADAVIRFADSLQPDDVALVHFPGHAARLNDDFLLLPSNAPPVGAAGDDLQRMGGLGLVELADQIRATGARAQLFIVDACRGDPYAQSSSAELAPSSCGEIGRQMPEGSFVLFSASAGQKALDRLSQDDPEAHSVFTRVLLRELHEARSIVRLARLVRDEVVEIATSVNYPQRPAYLDELVGSPVPLHSRDASGGPQTMSVRPPAPLPEPAPPLP